jgi:hypothetical protein
MIVRQLEAGFDRDTVHRELNARWRAHASGMIARRGAVPMQMPCTDCPAGADGLRSKRRRSPGREDCCVRAFPSALAPRPLAPPKCLPSRTARLSASRSSRWIPASSSSSSRRSPSYHALFFIGLRSDQLYLAGCIANPSGVR